MAFLNLHEMIGAEKVFLRPIFLWLYTYRVRSNRKIDVTVQP